MTVASLKRSLLDLGHRLPRPPSHPDVDALSAFEWLEDDELMRAEHLLAQVDLMGRDHPESLVAEAEFLVLMAQGEARRARGEPTVLERHLATFPPGR
jgi:hypothetical protein